MPRACCDQSSPATLPAARTLVAGRLADGHEVLAAQLQGRAVSANVEVQRARVVLVVAKQEDGPAAHARCARRLSAGRPTAARLHTGPCNHLGSAAGGRGCRASGAQGGNRATGNRATGGPRQRQRSLVDQGTIEVACQHCIPKFEVSHFHGAPPLHLQRPGQQIHGAVRHTGWGPQGACTAGEMRQSTLCTWCQQRGMHLDSCVSGEARCRVVAAGAPRAAGILVADRGARGGAAPILPARLARLQAGKTAGAHGLGLQERQLGARSTCHPQSDARWRRCSRLSSPRPAAAGPGCQYTPGRAAARS